jgi:hypothetical protein
MSDDIDDEFYDRADDVINLANKQITNETDPGRVSASLMYAVARFNAWLSACGWNSGQELADARDETLDYFVEEYRKMLEENLDEYIEHFETMMYGGPPH